MPGQNRTLFLKECEFRLNKPKPESTVASTQEMDETALDIIEIYASA
jgi:hypothetical protein